VVAGMLLSGIGVSAPSALASDCAEAGASSLLAPGLVVRVVTLATTFAGSAFAGFAGPLTPLPPFLDIEAKDEFAHLLRQAALLNWRDWAGFSAVSTVG